MTNEKIVAPDAGNTRSGHEKSSLDSISAPAAAVKPVVGKTEQVRQKITEGKRLGREMLAAMLAGVPVQDQMLTGEPVNYDYVGAIVYKPHPREDDIQMVVELVDSSGNSTTLASPGRVTVLWGDREPPEVPEDIGAMIQGALPINMTQLKEAMRRPYTVKWDGEKYRRISAAYFRHASGKRIYAELELVDLNEAIHPGIPADQIEITGHLLNRR